MISLLALAMVLSFIFCMALLVIRVQDQRLTHKENIILSQMREQQLSEETQSVMRGNRDVEKAKYEYGAKQAEFGARVLALVEDGRWNGDLEDLKAACIRQLDGIAPPHDAPQIAIKAEMPDLSGRYGRYGPAGYMPEGLIPAPYETRRM